MSGPSLSQLVSPSTQADALQLELTVAQTLSLPITSWQPLDPSRTIFQINSNIVAQYSQTVAFIAQGAYASTAAEMVDANNNPVTSWMDLRGVDQYNVTRIPATLAAGNVPVNNTSATTYSYSPNQPLHFQNAATGATYTTTGSGTIAGTSTNVQIAVQADATYLGTTGTSGVGVTLVLLTPLAGVTVQPLVTALVGSAAESNSAYLLRCQNKLGALSPNGAAQAYQYVATSVPVFSSTLPDGAVFTAPTANNPYGVTEAVTRATTVLGVGNGVVTVYAANASGGLIGCTQLPISNVTWLSGTATITTSGAHNLSPGQWIIIAGVKGATGVNNTVAGTPAWQCTTGTTGTTIKIAVASDPGTYTSGGTVEGNDLGMVDAAIQAMTVPNGQVAITAAATNVSVNVTATIYLPTKSGIGSAAATAAINTALTTYFGGVAIGGLTAESANIVPWSEILVVIANANAGTVSVQLTVPAVDVALATGEVPVLGSLAITVVYV